MKRKDQFIDAASELFKDDEFRIPNMYSFIKGAEWADNNPQSLWIKMSERKPQKDQPVVMATLHTKFKGLTYQIVRYNPMTCPSDTDYMFWMAVPEPPEELLRPLIEQDET